MGYIDSTPDWLVDANRFAYNIMWMKRIGGSIITMW
jgi:hypothetical protein